MGRAKITREKRWLWWVPARLVSPYQSALNTPSLPNAGHDICKDLADHGVGSYLVTVLSSALDTKRSSDVTMFQRSSTYVMSVTDGIRLVFGGSFRNFYEKCMLTENLLGLY